MPAEFRGHLLFGLLFHLRCPTQMMQVKRQEKERERERKQIKTMSGRGDAMMCGVEFSIRV